MGSLEAKTFGQAAEWERCANVVQNAREAQLLLRCVSDFLHVLERQEDSRSVRIQEIPYTKWSAMTDMLLR